MNNTTVDEKIVDLESRLAFQEDSILSFSDQLLRQTRELERLQIQLIAMHKRMQEMSRQLEEGEDTDDKPPPHY